jgi:hypothetical protein
VRSIFCWRSSKGSSWLEVVEGLFVAGGSCRDLELHREDLSKGWALERMGQYSDEAPARNRWWRGDREDDPRVEGGRGVHEGRRWRWLLGDDVEGINQ